MIYRKLKSGEITMELFQNFERRQVVTDCYRRENGKWVMKPAPFVDQWSEDEYRFLVQCLKRTIKGNGVVLGAFCDGRLKGFASVEGTPIGSRRQYLDLTSIHVSEDMRGRGIGKELFRIACGWAKEHGAEKLYISAHSAVETQRFYESMGCVDACEYMEEHVKLEPYDRQMEKVLKMKDQEAVHN